MGAQRAGGRWNVQQEYLHGVLLPSYCKKKKKQTPNAAQVLSNAINKSTFQGVGNVRAPLLKGRIAFRFYIAAF